MVSNFKRDGDLVCEALVREIYHATRWSAVMDTWRSLLKVREMQRQHIGEMEYLFPPNNAGSLGQEQANEEEIIP